MVTPAIFGATIASRAPSFSIALRNDASRPSSTPSVTNAATLRPFRVGSAFLTKLRLGEVKVDRLARRDDIIRRPFHAERGLDAGSERLSMIIRWPSMRLRTARVSTLPSSKANALMMWRCSGSDMERKNRRAWL